MQFSRLSTNVQAFFRNFANGRKVRLHPFVRLILIGLLTFVMATGWMSTAVGQIPLPINSDPPLLNQLPKGVQRTGSLEVAAVNFEGSELFKVASPAVLDRSKPGNLTPVEQRAQQIEANLNRLLQNNVSISNQGATTNTSYDYKTLQVGVATLNRETIILVKDENHPEPIKVMTVTQLDANYYGSPIGQVAEYMRTQIDSKVRQALKERTTASLKERANQAAYILLGMAIASFVLWLAQRFLKHRDRVLTARQEAEAPPIPDPTTVAPLTAPPGTDRPVTVSPPQGDQQLEKQAKFPSGWYF